MIDARSRCRPISDFSSYHCFYFNACLTCCPSSRPHQIKPLRAFKSHFSSVASHFIRLRGEEKVISFCTFSNVSAFVLKNLDGVAPYLLVMLTTTAL